MTTSSEEFDAIQTFNDFEHYLRGRSWSSLQDLYSFQSLAQFLKQAELVLASQYSNDIQKQNAINLIDTLNGEAPQTIYKNKESTELEKKQRSFQKRRNKLFKLLIERDGYSCHVCKITSDLCVSHEIPLTKGGESEMDNLKLRCKKCLRKRTSSVTS